MAEFKPLPRRRSLLDDVEAKLKDKNHKAPQDERHTVTLWGGLYGILSFVFGIGIIVGSLVNAEHHTHVAVEVAGAGLLLASSVWFLLPVVQTYRGIPGFRIPPELQDLF